MRFHKLNRGMIVVLVAAGCVVCASVVTKVGHTADPPAAAKTVEALSDYEEDEPIRRKANLKTFREAFEQGRSLSVRARLDRAATVTGELAALAEKVSDKNIAKLLVRNGHTSRAAIYPRFSHLVRLLVVRPWVRDQLLGAREPTELRELLEDSLELRWPTKKDQPKLRQLLDDSDPDIRAMAIEALATLHDPRDLELIGAARFMSPFGPTPTVSAPWMQGDVGGSGGLHQSPVIDPQSFEVIWRSSTVEDYITRAWRQMTGADIPFAKFDDWVTKHGNTRESLWYWQRRLEREFEQIDLSLRRHDFDKFWTERRSKHAELRKSLRAELANLDPQVEAKVILLTNDPHTDAVDIYENFPGFFDSPWQTRLTKDELFNLLEGERPWSDVDWVEQDRHLGTIANQLATRIMLNSERTFTREDVPRLQMLLDNPNRKLWWYGRAAWLIGISRLLPAAAPDNLADRETRDGYLQQAITDERDVHTRYFMARELVRVGLPNNAPFLRDIFFAEKDDNENITSDVRCSILESLGRPPLTDEKRKFLVDLITDKRCRPILTRPSERRGDVHREHAARSINAHAGRQLVSVQELQDQKKANEVLDRILETVKKFDAERAKPGVTVP